MERIDGKRIILRDWNENDVKDLFEYAVLDNVGPSAGWKPHKNIEESKQILKSFIQSSEVYAIELKKENKVIGSIGFHNRILNEEYNNLKQKEIAIVINPQYWGNEYAKEAINLLIDYGFNSQKLDLIWICHHLDNKKTERIIEKCNFKYVFQKDVVLERLNNKVVTMKYYIKQNIVKKI